MRKTVKVEKSEDWFKAKNFTPKKGEIVVYKDDEIRFKIGDGVTNINDLPFTNENISFQVLDGDFIVK